MIPKDPAMLLSFVNMKLRNNYKSLAELCEDLDADEEEIRDALASIGYRYDEASNRFC